MSSHVMPEPVPPAAGAVVVEYPWSEAASAVAELDAAACELDLQITDRNTSHPNLVEWEGDYRNEFDDIYDALMSRASGLLETLNGVAGAVAEGAWNAAEDQTTANQSANLRAQLGLDPPTRPNDGLGMY